MKTLAVRANAFFMEERNCTRITRIQERIFADLFMLIRVNAPEIRVICVPFLYAVALLLVKRKHLNQLGIGQHSFNCAPRLGSQRPDFMPVARKDTGNQLAVIGAPPQQV